MNWYRARVSTLPGRLWTPEIFWTRLPISGFAQPSTAILRQLRRSCFATRFPKRFRGHACSFCAGCGMKKGLIRPNCSANRSGAMSRQPSGSSECWVQRPMRESIQIEIYSRPGCHLCDEAKAVIEPFARTYQLKLTVTNVDLDSELRAAYGTEIPIILINGTEAFRHRVDARTLERKLKELWKPSIS